jgi:hypothetical protein
VILDRWGRALSYTPTPPRVLMWCPDCDVLALEWRCFVCMRRMTDRPMGLPLRQLAAGLVASELVA